MGRDGVTIAVATLLAGVLVKVFAVDACRVASPSMEPSLLPGDYLFFCKLPYSIPPLVARLALLSVGIPPVSSRSFDLPQRGDILVFDAPSCARGAKEPPGILFVKRCIGLPGDTVSVLNGVLRVNSQRVGMAGTGQIRDAGPCVVPWRGERISLDRKSLPWWRPVVESEGHCVALEPDGRFTIDGHQASTYTITENYLFVIGDNFGNSSDSRDWGPLSLDHVRGKALVTYWSRDPRADRSGFFARLDHTRWDRVGLLVH